MQDTTAPYYADDHVTLWHGDAATTLAKLPDGSVDCIVTSPPYFGLRDYGVDGQIGAEATPGQFVASLVDVFHEARRVLADDGTLWLNLGDSYVNAGGAGTQGQTGQRASRTFTAEGRRLVVICQRRTCSASRGGWRSHSRTTGGSSGTTSSGPSLMRCRRA